MEPKRAVHEAIRTSHMQARSRPAPIAGPLTVVSGRLADRHGHRTVIVPGMIAMITSAVLLATLVGDEPALVTVWLPVNVLYSVGVGLAHAACQAVAVSEVPDANLGIGAAMTRISQEIGNAITAAVAITILSSAAAPVDGLRSTMVLLGLVTAAALPVAWRLPRRRTVSPVP